MQKTVILQTNINLIKSLFVFKGGEIMNLYQILSLLFGSGLLTAILTAVWKKIKLNEKKTESVQLGIQALLRDRLYHTYMKYTEKGYAPIYARENFENMYNQYHTLGANGVMDDVYKKFMALPLENESEG